MPLTPEQQRNIQGVGLAGFRKDHQHLLFVNFPNASSAQALLSALRPWIASHLEVSAFNRAFSEILTRTSREDVISASWVGVMIGPRGYVALGVDLAAELPAGPGSEAFIAGMAARAPLIGHTRPNDIPTSWLAEFQPENGVHACIVLAADDPEELDHSVARTGDLVANAGCVITYQAPGSTLPLPERGHEHFGFKDGISQPAVEGVDPGPAQFEPPPVALGEFVLGYPDESERIPNARSLWRDGSFAAFERITQNVIAFRAQAAKAAEGTSPALSAAQIEAKMVGRWPDGTPTETAPTAPSEGTPTNAFQYNEAPFSDVEGVKTPHFAHIRKANPRDETRPDPADLVGRHRMIRRGIPFGDPLPPGASADDGVQRGLHFFCFVADLARQFEFVQHQWINEANFPNGGTPGTPGGPYTPPVEGQPPDGPDPVVGEHDPGAQCALRQGSAPHTFALGGEVVSVTAGEYFFAPSLSAIAALAQGQQASAQ